MPHYLTKDDSSVLNSPSEHPPAWPRSTQLGAVASADPDLPAARTVLDLDAVAFILGNFGSANWLLLGPSEARGPTPVTPDHLENTPLVFLPERTTMPSSITLLTPESYGEHEQTRGRKRRSQKAIAVTSVTAIENGRANLPLGKRRLRPNLRVDIDAVVGDFVRADRARRSQGFTPAAQRRPSAAVTVPNF
jgi:hypothetical protein